VGTTESRSADTVESRCADTVESRSADTVESRCAGITESRHKDTTEFKALVRREGARLYRDLPWRNTHDPYLVLCSEVMLQQTQVKRVLNYWDKWIATFPTVDALAAASTADVLAIWQGLGYNRRALALKKAAEECSQRFSGKIPDNYQELLALPGVGPTTAAGVCIFAFEQVHAYLETNVRTVFIHHFFKDCDKVRDTEIIPLLRQCCDADDPRGWYYTLLDFGSHLKQIMPNPSRRSSHYAKQSTFEGSARQKRAFLLRELLSNSESSTEDMLVAINRFELQAGRDPITLEDVENILHTLANDGFIVSAKEGLWSIAQ